MSTEKTTWEEAREEMWEEASILDEARTGDILLVPLRVKKRNAETIELRPMHPELNTGTERSGISALYLLHNARETCTMCQRYRAFRDYPNEGYCECEGRVEAWRESCINYKSRN